MTKNWEPKVTQFVREYLKPQMTFVDIGAYEGHYTFLAASLCQRVLAFEPVPRFASGIRNCAQRDDLPVTVYGNTLYSTVQSGSIFSAGDPKTRVHHTFHPGLETDDEHTYFACTLDSFSIANADLIKMDVEGAEFDILLGAIGTIEKCRPTWVVELHPTMESIFGWPMQCIYTFFERFGYRWYPLNWSGDLKAAWNAKKMCHIVAEPV